jgi:hypothetical protein
MKILRLAFTGLLAGFILSIFAGRSIWLEIRINTGLFLPLMKILTIFTGTLFKGRVQARVAVAMEIFRQSHFAMPLMRRKTSLRGKRCPLSTRRKEKMKDKSIRLTTCVKSGG